MAHTIISTTGLFVVLTGPINGSVTFEFLREDGPTWYNPETESFDSLSPVYITPSQFAPDIPVFSYFVAITDFPSTTVLLVRDNNSLHLCDVLFKRYDVFVSNRSLTMKLDQLTNESGALFTTLRDIMWCGLRNVVEDDIVRDEAGNKISCVLYGYDSPENVQLHDKSTGLYFRMQYVMSYDGNGTLSLFKSYLL